MDITNKHITAFLLTAEVTCSGSDQGQMSGTIIVSLRSAKYFFLPFTLMISTSSIFKDRISKHPIQEGLTWMLYGRVSSHWSTRVMFSWPFGTGTTTFLVESLSLPFTKRVITTLVAVTQSLFRTMPSQSTKTPCKFKHEQFSSFQVVMAEKRFCA